MSKSILYLMAPTLAGCQTVPPQPATMADDTTDWAAIEQRGNELFDWPLEERRYNFAHMEDLFPGDEVAGSATPRTLDMGVPLDRAVMDDLMKQADLSGLLVIDKGKIRYEGYLNDFGPEQRWTSFSIAKTFVGVLVGAAIKDGRIKSVDDPVIQYLPELHDTAAFQGVTIEHLLTMTSGVGWIETEQANVNEAVPLFTNRATGGGDGTVQFFKDRKRVSEPGAKYDYSSGDTSLLGVIVERATGRSLSDYAKEKIVDPAGFEGDLFWMRDRAGHNIGPCCLSLGMRDYGRYALWIMDGLPDGKGGSIWTDAYRENALSVQQPGADKQGYGYQMNVNQRVYWHSGLFGQAVVMGHQDDVVLVHLAAHVRGEDGGSVAPLQRWFADFVSNPR